MLEGVINEFALFQMYDTRLSDSDYTHYVAMPTHTHMHTCAHTATTHTHALVFQIVRHWGGNKGPKRELFKEFPIVKSSNIFLNQLEAW